MTRIFAVDWSGAQETGRGGTCLAEVVDGQLRRVEHKRREDVIRELLAERDRDPDFVVGLDFAFSFPAWFLRERHLASARALWELAARDGESWLSACDPPFWGRPGRKLPTLPDHYRETDRVTGGVGSSRAKSVFQIGGAGAVGTASLRGMPFLARLQDAGFSIWPFDEPGRSQVVEIYPRVLTGAVVKSDRDARAAYLVREYPDLSLKQVDVIAATEDAFDAAVSALVMSAHHETLRELRRPGGEQVPLEGWIWKPEPLRAMSHHEPHASTPATTPPTAAARPRTTSRATDGRSSTRAGALSATATARRPLRDLKVAVLGAGRIGETLIAGLLEAEVVQAESVTATAGHDTRVEELRKKLGVAGTLSNARAAEAADLVLLTVKPRTVPAVLEEIRGVMRPEQLLVSVAAAVSTRFIEERLGAAVPVVRAMPNTPCLLKRGMTGLCAGRHATAEHLELATFLFEAVGRTVVVDEKHMDAVTGLSASGPAYVYVMIESLAEGGVKVGLPREIATQLAAQTVLGAAAMVLETGEHPAKLKDTVTTPAGCTIDGLLELEEGGLRVTLIKTVVTATRRAGELLDA